MMLGTVSLVVLGGKCLAIVFLALAKLVCNKLAFCTLKFISPVL
jgi:hypothetical protein